MKAKSSGNFIAVKTADDKDIPIDTWTLAYWADGSVKWQGVAGVIPAGTEKLILEKAVKVKRQKNSKAEEFG